MSSVSATMGIRGHSWLHCQRSEPPGKFNSGEKAGKPNRNLTTVHLFLKILKYDIKSWKHSQNLGSLGDFEKKVF